MPNVSKLSQLSGGLLLATCQMTHAETASMAIRAPFGGRHEPTATGTPTLPGSGRATTRRRR